MRARVGRGSSRGSRGTGCCFEWVGEGEDEDDWIFWQYEYMYV